MLVKLLFNILIIARAVSIFLSIYVVNGILEHHFQPLHLSIVILSIRLMDFIRRRYGQY